MKRTRRRKSKRSSRGDRSQVDQKLSKKIRELYVTGTAADSEAALVEWEEVAAPAGGPAVQRPAPTGEALPPAPARGGRRGRVVGLASGLSWVEDGDETVACVLPSKLARDQQSSVAVGDEVSFVPTGEARESALYRIETVSPRRTVLSRPDPLNPRLDRVIAANVDVAVHVASVAQPPLRPALIDRYLIAIARGGAQAVLCVNKIDLLGEAAAGAAELEDLEPYRRQGLTILTVSAKTGQGIAELRRLLAGKTAVFVGHSGTGKSSIIRALHPELELAVGAVDRRGGKGTHTTTRSRLYHLDFGIDLIDTPGIRELGLFKIELGELRAFFPDLEEHAAGCRFRDCSHRHEPDCAVKAAVELGELNSDRFLTYLRILASLEEDSPR